MRPLHTLVHAGYPHEDGIGILLTQTEIRATHIQYTVQRSVPAVRNKVNHGLAAETKLPAKTVHDPLDNPA